MWNKQRLWKSWFDLHVTVICNNTYNVVHCCSIFLWDLDWKYSARWEPSIWRCRLLSALQRTEMTNLDQFFCMWYLLCVWREASKMFVHFLLLLPPEKGRSIRSGCFFQNYGTYGIFGMPLQFIFSFFARWKIWDQERYNCNIISEMNTNMIKKSCQESSSKVKHYWQHDAIYSSSI